MMTIIPYQNRVSIQKIMYGIEKIEIRLKIYIKKLIKKKNIKRNDIRNQKHILKYSKRPNHKL